MLLRCFCESDHGWFIFSKGSNNLGQRHWKQPRAVGVDVIEPTQQEDTQVDASPHKAAFYTKMSSVVHSFLYELWGSDFRGPLKCLQGIAGWILKCYRPILVTKRWDKYEIKNEREVEQMKFGLP